MDRIAADQVMEMDNQNIYHNLTFERFAHSLLPENNIKTRDDNVLPGKSYLDSYHKIIYIMSVFMGVKKFLMQIPSEFVWL